MSWGLLQNSLVVASAATVLAGAFGICFALFASGLPRTPRNGAVAASIVALVLPPFLVTNTWMNYFGLNGTWRAFLNFDIYSLPATVLLLSLLLWPIPFLLTLAGILRIDRTYLDQEPLLQGIPLLRYVFWPNCRSSLLQGLALTFVLALNNFAVPTLLQTKVYAAEVWLSFNTKFDYAEAWRLSWPLVLGPIVLLALFRVRPQRFVFRSDGFSGSLWRNRLGVLFPSACFLSGVLVLVSIVFPLCQLLFSSRTWTEFLPAMSAGRGAAWNSILFALLPALLVLGFGILLARRRAAGLSWLLFLTPGVLLGIGLIWSLNRPAFHVFYQGIGIVLLAFTLRYLAIGWSGARAGFSSVDPSLAAVVTTFGGSRWQQFRLTEWPQGRHALLASFYVVYLLCLWEVETLILIVPPGRETLALRIFNMLHYGHAGQVDALCVWLLIMALLPLVILVAIRGLNSGGFVRKTALLATGLCFLGCDSKPQTGTHVESKLFSSVQVFGSRGTGVGQFNKPRSIAVDRRDNFYVVDMTGRVQKFTPEGQFVLSWQMPQTDKGKPKGMICDHEGNIIVVEPHYSRANHFTPDGKLASQWGDNGTNDGQLYFPRAVAVNSNGEIYLSEYGMVERIQRFSPHGSKFMGRIGSAGTAPGELNRAEGIGIGPDQNLFVADSCNHRVQIFSPDGKLIETFGKAGSGPNEMSYPYDVRVDPLGYRFVCEFGNSRVQIFDAQNRSVEILGGAGGEPGSMNNPWAIALDSRGNLYVADSLNHRVQKFIRREPLAPAATHAGVAREARSIAAR